MADKKPLKSLDDQVMKNLTKNFHREPFAQRIEKLSKILPNLDTKILQNGGLSIELADNMIENCI